MSLCKIKMPDLGEGMTECEIVEWEVKVGDTVKEDDVLAGVMTDKAVVEIPSPVDGVIKQLSGEIGELVPVGTVIVVLEVSDNVRAEASEVATSAVTTGTNAPAIKTPTAETGITPQNQQRFNPQVSHTQTRQSSPQARPLSAPAVKQRAKTLGIDLATISGSGPEGRILHQDIDQHLLSQTSTPVTQTLATKQSNTFRQISTPNSPILQTSTLQSPAHLANADEITTTPVIGLRRKIAERMQDAKQRIPHITYVEAIDVTELESLRTHLNRQRRDDQEKLSLLPLLFRAMVLATRVYPVMNAHYDDVAGELHQYQALHIGVATQTERGLLVPVLRHAEQMDIWETAAAIQRLATLARQGTLARAELSGSTITCSSLGKLGGLVSTPVINSPEVCVIGVNKIQTQPVYKDGGFVPRQMMNLSSSFDHRIVDGYEAAQFVQCLREHLEHPATLFIEE